MAEGNYRHTVYKGYLAIERIDSSEAIRMSIRIMLINFTGGIPVGLSYLSACVKDQPRRDVRIMDCGEDSLSRARLIETITQCRPHVIGATVYTYNATDILDFLQAVKHRDPSIITVVGGPHPTALPEAMAKYPSVDVVVRGEGEITFQALIERLEKRESYHDLDGIAYCSDGKVTVNRPRDFIRDLDTLPFPMWQDLPIETYTHPDYGHPRMNKKNFINMLATRGCPFHCIFCGAADVWGRKVRKHSPARIAQEMQILHEKHGVHSIRFADSTFTIDRKWLLELCDILQSLDMDVAWEANARADTIDEHLLVEMKKAKCMSVTIGVESGDENVLRINKKNQDLDQVRKAFRDLKKARIFSWAFFMIGCPGETKESIMRTIEFAVELDPDQVSVCAYATPYPGTEFYTLAKEEASIEDIPWEDFHHSRKIIYIPQGLTESDIEEGKKLFCQLLRPHERHVGRMEI